MNTLILPDYIFTEANMPESQSQSLLLTKLPPELRLMIWDHALDACTLHFDCVDGRLQSVWCNDANDATKFAFFSMKVINVLINTTTAQDSTDHRRTLKSPQPKFKKAS